MKPMTQTPEALLDRLSQLRQQAVLLPQQRLEALLRQLEPAVAEQVQNIFREFEELELDLRSRIADLEQQIKDRVLLTGASAAGSYLQAVIVAPRITWDTKAMEVYRTLHPEVDPYRKVGQPSVTIRAFSPKP
jgi:hypothetical protein